VLAFLQMRNGWYLLPGLSIDKLYSISMLVLLNNRFIILGGRNSLHPNFDIPSYRRSETEKSSGTNSGATRNLAFIHTRPTDTATGVSGGILTIELATHLQRVSEESHVIVVEEKKSDVV
jgi:hypothetical protein